LWAVTGDTVEESRGVCELIIIFPSSRAIGTPSHRLDLDFVTTLSGEVKCISIFPRENLQAPREYLLHTALIELGRLEDARLRLVAERNQLLENQDPGYNLIWGPARRVIVWLWCRLRNFLRNLGS
jgi:hypothetical protein